VDRLPVHELSAVNGHSLRFKYSATLVLEGLDVGGHRDWAQCLQGARNRRALTRPETEHYLELRLKEITIQGGELILRPA